MEMTQGARLNAASLDSEDWCGKLELLILQASPLCNLDCDYCYLPHRDDGRRMEFGTLEAAAWKVFRAGLPASRLSVIWHAGEPMAVPPAWYEEAIARLASHCPNDVCLSHHFQTNGVLIDHRWCDFIKRHDIRIGVSLDGPAWLHDRHRRSRDGRGTHARVMRGIDVLREAGIPFHVICVLTQDSLGHADALFDFFGGLGVSQLCFNIEEIEAANARSSLAGEQQRDIEEMFRQFMARIVDRLPMAPHGLRVREVDSVLGALRHPVFGRLVGNSQNQPGRILSIAWDGSYSSFSPELLGARHPKLGDLSLGNVLFDPIPPEQTNSDYAAIRGEIADGIVNCQRSCKYFHFCLGGAPSNKLGETGRFDSTETMFCRLTQKVVTDVVLSALERDLLQLS